MKGDLMVKALEIVEEIGCGVSDLLFIFSLPYGTSLGKALRELEKRQARRRSRAQDFALRYQERRRVYNLIYRLKQDRLIEESSDNKFRLTLKGKERLIKLQNSKTQSLPAVTYVPIRNSEWTIIIFDIPEEERRKRQWLRSALRNMGFRMLQKSVWTGKAKLPKIFLGDLAGLKLLDYVHIFAITKSGSLTILTR